MSTITSSELGPVNCSVKRRRHSRFVGKQWPLTIQGGPRVGALLRLSSGGRRTVGLPQEERKHRRLGPKSFTGTAGQVTLSEMWFQEASASPVPGLQKEVSEGRASGRKSVGAGTTPGTGQKGDSNVLYRGLLGKTATRV